MTNQAAESTLVYVGTYTPTEGDAKGKAEGIYIDRLQAGSSALTSIQTITGVDNPSYLALHPNGRYLYVAEELIEGRVAAYSIDPASGGLTLLNRLPTHGADPAHISVDRDGKWVLVANYTSGNTAVYPIEADGSVGAPTSLIQHEGSSVDPDRQEGPHAHYITTDPDNRFVLVADLGIDKIMVYRLDATNGTLTPNDPPWATMEPGSGPRHLTFHRNGRYVYVLHELDSSVTVCSYDAERGELMPIQRISTLPTGWGGDNTCAAIHLAPTGSFLYCSNRGHDSIAVFAIDDTTGMLTYVENTLTGGKEPRDFNLHPNGRLLLAGNQNSDTITSFDVDPATGRLTATGDSLPVLTPVCIVFYPG